MLLLSSQPKESTLAKNAQLKQIQVSLKHDADFEQIEYPQIEFGLLLYRYLCSTIDQDKAAQQTHSLIGMMDRLHKCGDILMNKRIKMLPEDSL